MRHYFNRHLLFQCLIHKFYYNPYLNSSLHIVQGISFSEILLSPHLNDINLVSFHVCLNKSLNTSFHSPGLLQKWRFQFPFSPGPYFFVIHSNQLMVNCSFVHSPIVSNNKKYGESRRDCITLNSIYIFSSFALIIFSLMLVKSIRALFLSFQCSSQNILIGRAPIFI